MRSWQSASVLEGAGLGLRVQLRKSARSGPSFCWAWNWETVVSGSGERGAGSGETGGIAGGKGIRGFAWAGGLGGNQRTILLMSEAIVGYAHRVSARVIAVIPCCTARANRLMVSAAWWRARWAPRMVSS